MLTETHPARQRIASPVLWALTSGITGVVANVLLVLSFLLGPPFGVNGPLAQAGQDFMWLGSANDVVIIVQFVTFIPVALALRRWLPPARSVQLATAAAIGAMVVVAVLQLLLVAGVLEFDLQVVLVVATFLVVYAWAFLDLFPMYGDPWSSRLSAGTFVALLAVFLVVTGLAAWSAWWLWQGRKVGALVNLALLPVEAIFWLGFALPFPWLVGAARAVLIAIAWRSLTTGQNPQESGIDLDRQPT
jgi:hypothetical protein